MTTEEFLDLLMNVKLAGKGRWMAQCPAHEDKHASLSVRAAADGRTLLNDFGMQCTAFEICAAVGIRLTDIMPPNEKPYMRPEDRGKNLTEAKAVDLLELIDHHAGVVWLCAVNIALGRALDKDEVEAVTLAKRVLGDARALIRPSVIKASKI